jgi:hypothetical protein
MSRTFPSDYVQGTYKWGSKKEIMCKRHRRGGGILEKGKGYDKKEERS